MAKESTVVANDNADKDGVIEFVCVDCGYSVFNVSGYAEQTERCLTCLIVHQAPDDQKEMLRELRTRTLIWRNSFSNKDSK